MKMAEPRSVPPSRGVLRRIGIYDTTMKIGGLSEMTAPGP